MFNRVSKLTASIIERFFNSAKIKNIESVGNAYTIVTLKADCFRHRRWNSSKRLSLRTGPRSFHSFSIFDWRDDGSLSFLISRSEDQEVQKWIDGRLLGEPVRIIGPHMPVQMDWQTPAVLVLSESQIGYAKVLYDAGRATRIRFVFEVKSHTVTILLMNRLRIENASVVPVSKNCFTLAAEVQKQMDALETESVFVLSAQTDCDQLDKQLSFNKSRDPLELGCVNSL